MSDQPAPPTPAPPVTPPSAPSPAPPAPPAQPAAEAEDQRVPYSRFTEVNDKLKTASTELEELRAWKTEQEQAKLTEVEKAQRAVEEATQRATDAEQRAITLERAGWVAAAARKHGFAEPEAIATSVNLASVADEEAAGKLVEQLAAATGAGQAKPQGFGSLQGQRVQQPVPVGPDGEPDLKQGLGAELMNGLLRGR